MYPPALLTRTTKPRGIERIPIRIRTFGENNSGINTRKVQGGRGGLSRNELRNLSDRDLQDIGLSRGDARREYAKPFWMA